MTDNMKKFLEKVSADKALSEKARQMNVAELIALAAELGCTLTEADLASSCQELSDDEMDAVAGGDKCFCAVGGGGTGDSNDKTCACVLGGGGDAKNKDGRCVCFMGGNGRDT